MAEVRHQEVMAAFMEQLRDANSRAERAEKTANDNVRDLESRRKAGAASSVSEKQHAEQISRYQKQLDDANHLAARAANDKFRVIKNASLREEVNAKLEARLKQTQDTLEKAEKHRKVREQGEAELASLKDGQIASLKRELERERSDSEETRLESRKMIETRLAEVRSDCQRQVADLVSRVREVEAGRKKAELMARDELAKLNRVVKSQDEQVVRLTALLAAERAKRGDVPAAVGEAEYRPGLVARTHFFGGAAVVVVVAVLVALFLGWGFFGEGESMMLPCGPEGYKVFLCRK